MSRPFPDRWSVARTSVIVRWERILSRIEARDEGGVLALTCAQDEFCEEAALERARRTGTDASAELRCHFCPAEATFGGCLGLVGGLNHAVLTGDWPAARGLAAEYLRGVSAAGGS